MDSRNDFTQRDAKLAKTIVGYVGPKPYNRFTMRALLAFFAISFTLWPAAVPERLRPSLSLHASFDSGLDADFARGDRSLYHAADYKQQGSAKAGAGDADVALEKSSGLAGGGALRFRSKNTHALFFRGNNHVSLAGGTISFWLRLDPQKDLAPGFCDPIQITDKAYNDSAIWVDFTKDEVPRHFRLGVFGSLKAWNPTDAPPDKNPDFLQRLIVVERPPFSRDRWTHVAVTWSGLNAVGSRSASLFLDGKRISTVTKIAEPFEWDPQRLAIRLGVNYVGLMDEVMVFLKALNESEVALLQKLR